MDKLQSDMNYARETGLCPVCRKRQRAVWSDDGGIRMTCGSHHCFMTWLPIRYDGSADTANDALLAGAEE